MEVTTDLTNEEVTESLKGETKELWSVFRTLQGDLEFEKDYELVRSGIDIEFDIRLITKGFYEEVPSMGIVKLYKKKQIKIIDFWNEMDKRDEKMKDILRKQIDDSFDNQSEAKIKGFEDDN